MRSKHRARCWVLLALAATADAAIPAWAQTSQSNLSRLSLEELSNIEITSASKRAERLSDAPTSVFVITADDIRRSGMTSLPEVLRLAPNLQVARATAAGYLISARGFNGNATNKLLVLIDGRSVYTPFFSGVFWDVQDLVLEDIERIEVISGPGGTLWGVNAVNGVINIITRSATETQNTLVAAVAGNRETGLALRHGAAAGSDGAFRVYTKGFERRHNETASGVKVDDAMWHAQVGFRADWSTPGRKLSVHGNAYEGRRDQPLPGVIATGVAFELGEVSVSGANLVGQWERGLEGGGRLAAQAYYDRTHRTVPPTFAEKLEIFDLQLQHSLQPTAAHTMVWGAQYRLAMDRVTNSVYIAFLPAKVDQKWISLFAQDEITLRDDLRLTLGARIERNDYTGSEFLPNLRLAWKLAPEQLLWMAASRTVRAPSRLDHDTFVPGQPPFVLTGGPEVRSEVAKVLELGYRAQPAANLSYSVTAYHADYDHLRTQELAPSQTSVFFGNGMQGRVRGVEAWSSYEVSKAWRLSAGVSRLWQDLQLRPGSNDAVAVRNAEGANPQWQWLLRSSHDLGSQAELDVFARHVSRLAYPAVPRYTAVDLRGAWRPTDKLELSLTAQNLLDSGHGEFNDVATRAELGRAVLVKLAARF
jgi:iron complex outermembrane receptor protein